MQLPPVDRTADGEMLVSRIYLARIRFRKKYGRWPSHVTLNGTQYDDLRDWAIRTNDVFATNANSFCGLGQIEIFGLPVIVSREPVVDFFGEPNR